MEKILDPNIYPIGTYQHVEPFTDQSFAQCMQQFSSLPALLREATEMLTDEQINTPYREGGWTIRQVVHHMADSHCNGYLRMKLALTEDNPTVKPYDENLWAALPDGSQMPLTASLSILDGIHQRWVYMMEHISAADWTRTYFHPQYQKTVMIKEIITLYAWHGKHHLAQITTLLKNKNW